MNRVSVKRLESPPLVLKVSSLRRFVREIFHPIGTGYPSLFELGKEEEWYSTSVAPFPVQAGSLTGTSHSAKGHLSTVNPAGSHYVLGETLCKYPQGECSIPIITTIFRNI